MITKKTVNKITEEEIYIMKIDTNGLVYDVCINKEDLLGEPQIGRRFKGIFGCRDASAI